MQNWKGIRCKSFTLPGIDGGELIISETIERDSIEVSIRSDTGSPQMTTCTVNLTKVQFEALCNMNSAYDGLEVKPAAQPEEEPRQPQPIALEL